MTLISDITNSGMVKLKETYQYVLLGIVTAIVGVFIGLPMSASITGMTFWVLIGLEFAVLFWFMFRPSIMNYLIFTTLTGLTLIPVLAGLLSAGAGYVILQALIGTAVVVLLMTSFATNTTINFLSYSRVLIYILVGIIIVSLVNIFFIGSSLMSLIISWAVLGIFSMFIVHDTQQVIHTDINPLDAAMGMYLNILNIFTALLNILNSDD